MLMEGCGTCLTDVIGGRLGRAVAAGWRGTERRPAAHHDGGQVLVRDDLEEPVGFDALYAFDCLAPWGVRGHVRRRGRSSSPPRAAASRSWRPRPAAPELRRIRFGADGLVAIWRRQRDGNSETVMPRSTTRAAS
ncbi:MAG: hypothetical protein R3F43_09755 [bacterium]